MHVLIDSTTRVVLAYGTFTADPADPSQELVDIDDGEGTKFQQTGVKTLLPDGTISVTPDLAAQAAEQARLDAVAAAEAQHAQAVQTLMAAMPSDDVRGALAFILGLPTP